MKALVKKAYNIVASKSSLRKYKLQLLFVFHTEKIYNDEIYNNLKEFCFEYYSLTGAKAICTIIPPTNLKLQKEMKEASFDNGEFVERLRELEKISTLGYHGHFFQNNTPEYWNAIHCNSFQSTAMIDQFNKDLEWFKKNDINHNGIYAAGWWFMNSSLMDMLLANGFRCDFSFSLLPYFYNSYFAKLRQSDEVKLGEILKLRSPSKSNEIIGVQNFIGIQKSSDLLEFDRNLLKLIKRYKMPDQMIGSVNSHDYDLNIKNALTGIKHLLEDSKATFLSFKDIQKLHS